MVITLFNIAGTEIFVVILAVVILFGAKRIPEIARGFGKGIREFKNATSDIQEEIRKTTTEITDRADPTKSPKKQEEKTQDQPQDTAYRK